MSANRVILHVDMDAFFAAVEQHDHPELRGRPVVVGSAPNQRGVVSAASYEARKYGIHSAMPSGEAGRRCPHAVFRPVNMKRYQEVSRRIFILFERFSPLVEPLSVDEAFLDVTGARNLFGTGPEIARQIKDTIRRETGLTASVGVAPNMFLAKLASDLEKPDGLTITPRTGPEIALFLAPMPIERIWGVGKVTRDLLQRAGIYLIGDLQVIPRSRLEELTGRHGAQHLQRLAHGEDARELDLVQVEKSISREHTFSRDCNRREQMLEVLLELVDRVGSQLRKNGKYARTTRIKLRWSDFQTITRQKKIEPACCDDFQLRREAHCLFAALELSAPVRLIGFGVSDLADSASEQLTLFGPPPEARHKREKLSRIVDAIRDKYGDDSIGRSSLSRDIP